MSKELEALKNIVNEISNYKLHGLGDENWLGIQDIMQDMIVVEQALTPPTAEQLCEELSKHMNEPVWLDERNEIRISTQWLVRKIYYDGEYKGLSFLVVLPPRLIKRIAQFYENEVK